MIKLICVGKIKEQYFKEAIKEYEKRLSKYTKLKIIEIEDEPLINGIEKEGINILKNINEKDYVITLEIDGNMLTNIELEHKLSQNLIINSNITFVIGGSYGLSETVKQRSNYKLSFSKQTFPHQLFRIMFLEQLYRTFKIKNNETYHK